MNNRRALFYQAIRGPILLITVGSLFALQQAGYASFGRTWPILLIVIGLMKLLERSAAPMVPYGVPGGNPGGYAPPPSGPSNYGNGPSNPNGGFGR